MAICWMAQSIGQPSIDTQSRASQKRASSQSTASMANNSQSASQPTTTSQWLAKNHRRNHCPGPGQQ